MCVDRRGHGDDVNLRPFEIGNIARKFQMACFGQFVCIDFARAIRSCFELRNAPGIDIEADDRTLFRKLDSKGQADIAEADNSYRLLCVGLGHCGISSGRKRSYRERGVTRERATA